MGKLFEPITINCMTLKNRVLMLPMVLGLGVNNPQARAFYRERALGGVGAITTAATSIDLFLSDRATVLTFVEELRLLVNEVHEGGAKIGMQIVKSSRYVRKDKTSGKPQPGAQGERVAPSARTEPSPAVHPGSEGAMRGLELEEVEDIVSDFGKAAAGVKEAGFDYVEVHGSHGNLMCQFFSPVDNQRGDRYGGSLEGRMRFGLEVVAKARKSAGSDFPIFFRIPAIDDRPMGITLEQSSVYAEELEKAGVDCFSVSVGTSNRPYWTYASPSRKSPMGTYAHLAAAIKRAVNVPVVAAGRNNTPEVAEAILSEGKADLIGIGRQLITDPMWAKKVMEGRAADIVACDSCNINCWAHLGYTRVPPGSPMCKFNVQAGRESVTPQPAA